VTQGYAFVHKGKAYFPNREPAQRMSEAEAEDHNRRLSAGEVREIRANLPARLCGYLKKDPTGAVRVTTWIGDTWTDDVWAKAGRRWSPFDGRWHTIVRGHAHVREACYTFSGDYGMLTRLRRVGPCPRRRLPPVPRDFPVQPLRANQTAIARATCGTCGRSWDDGKPTSWTPAPSARCPFEDFHAND
jgi:hypothetical protein